ncbi:hypothetical protein [Candidatus Fukatsuia endosymbiont of Tuberolachnus salignus]|uniref:hypothetical protein n=1 Tax=Candidatus Fukatsuia endosymbiont of Tuberolachnus salignus TaxID=3077957 RepID=UPI00313C22AA
MASAIFSRLEIKNQKITVDGSSPQSPEALLAKKNFPFLGKIIHVYMSNGWNWGGRLLELNGIIPLGHYVVGEEREMIVNKKCLIPITHSNNYYIIRSDLKNVLIDFNKQQCN